MRGANNSVSPNKSHVYRDSLEKSVANLAK